MKYDSLFLWVYCIVCFILGWAYAKHCVCFLLHCFFVQLLLLTPLNKVKVCDIPISTLDRLCCARAHELCGRKYQTILKTFSANALVLLCQIKMTIINFQFRRA